MLTELYWVNGPWPGRLALAARPRGGEWLEDELTGWQRSGIDTVFSLLTPEEERDLDIVEEATKAQAQSMRFLSYPILDRQVPDSESRFARALEKLEAELTAGRNVVLHCRQGVGRTGLVAACLLLTTGVDPEAAVAQLSATRGAPVPETSEQRRWIDQYAERLVTRDAESRPASSQPAAGRLPLHSSLPRMRPCPMICSRADAPASTPLRWPRH